MASLLALIYCALVSCGNAQNSCAHDRYRFGVGGWGRLSIGLYSLYLEKWLEHFRPDQFFVVRLEDYGSDPQGYMKGIFDFLGLEEPKNWKKITMDMHFNEAKGYREPLLEETETALREFYRPYNELLADFMGNDRFLWPLPKDENTGRLITLRDKQLEDAANPSKSQQQKQQKQRSRENAHGLDRHAVSGSAPAHHGGEGDSNGGTGLRGSGRIELSPKRFDLGLLRLEDFGYKSSKTGKLRSFDGKKPDPNMDWSSSTAGMQLCKSAYALDVAALKYLLYDVGVPGDLVFRMEANRNAFHCLSVLGNMADAQPFSHVFAQLKGLGDKSWLHGLMEPQLPVELSSVAGQEIMNALEGSILAVAEWLLAAKTPIDSVDAGGNTPLHFACSSGMVGLVRFFVDHGADIQKLNREGRPPISVCLAYGQAEAASFLFNAKAKMDIKDKFGISPMDMLVNPGTITAADALKYFQVSQRSTKQIIRIINPELSPNDPLGWAAGTGNWETTRLAGFEEDMDCPDIDQYTAKEITSDIVFEHFARNAPIMVRGLLEEWEAVKNYAKDVLRVQHGDREVPVCIESSAFPFDGTVLWLV
jgi:hypothetical protein